ncbi:hypothetical protein [Neorhodopirellula lusitana]|uniref:hypothetical protein n=1 Tax=Neorhodopirellula lusitana TaxID=445327 RepID=UPI00384B2C97
MNKLLVGSLCIALLSLFALKMLGVWPFNGVAVVIHNTGSEHYASCTVLVTGARYPLGSLEPGDKLSTSAWPTGDSTVLIELITDDGSSRILDADCYFGNGGYSGAITIDIANGAVSTVTDDIRIGFP